MFCTSNFNCKFFDKLRVLDFFNVVFYSDKHNAIYDVGIRSKYLTLPANEDEDDWKVAYWFRFGSVSRKEAEVSRNMRSVVSQSTQASVIEQP